MPRWTAILIGFATCILPFAASAQLPAGKGICVNAQGQRYECDVVLRPGEHSKWARSIAPEIDWAAEVERTQEEARRAEVRRRNSPEARRAAAWAEMIRPCSRDAPCACAIAIGAASMFCGAGARMACARTYRGAHGEPEEARRCRARPDEMHATLREVCGARASLQQGIDRARSAEVRRGLRKGLAELDRIRPMLERPPYGEAYYRKQGFGRWWAAYCAADSPADFLQQRAEARQRRERAVRAAGVREQRERRERTERERERREGAERERELRSRRLEVEPAPQPSPPTAGQRARDVFELVGLAVDDPRVARTLAALGEPTHRSGTVRGWSHSRRASEAREQRLDVQISGPDGVVEAVTVGGRWRGRLPYRLSAVPGKSPKWVLDGDDLKLALGRPHAIEQSPAAGDRQWTWRFEDVALVATLKRSTGDYTLMWLTRRPLSEDERARRRAAEEAEAARRAKAARKAARAAELEAKQAVRAQARAEREEKRAARRAAHEARIAEMKALQAEQAAERARLGSELTEPPPRPRPDAPGADGRAIFDLVGLPEDDPRVVSTLAALGPPARSADGQKAWRGLSVFSATVGERSVVAKVMLEPDWSGELPYGLSATGTPPRGPDLEAALGPPLSRRKGFRDRAVWVWRFGDVEIYAFFRGDERSELRRLEKRRVADAR